MDQQHVGNAVLRRAGARWVLIFAGRSVLVDVVHGPRPNALVGAERPWHVRRTERGTVAAPLDPAVAS